MLHKPRLCLAAALGIFVIFISGQVGAQEGPTPAEIVEAWQSSPHADSTSEAFRHWDAENEIPGSCAVCHSSTGLVDYVSKPIATVGAIDHGVATGTTVDCNTCHSPDVAALASVPFPSGASVDTFGSSAVCAVCHQGRASGARVEAAVDGLEDDVISGDLAFINVHYLPSAAVLMGDVVQAGYQYPGKSYKGQFTHIPNLNTCVGCHDPHTLGVDLETCSTCHQGVTRFEDIRISPADFDGDGDASAGIAAPIAAFQARLEVAIQRYATDVVGTAIVYEIGTYPYFFVDTDGDGVASADEAAYPNRYQSWTPRLLKAAYNYQLMAKNRGIYTHNPHYALQLLYDSLEDLSADISGLTRP